ncbi:DUF1941-domain-containing protein [Xylona heveae TC161]|uniref:DUF1941-domain-containing protein n=1 Tax=Xylona heveae (strain CBS 132557 / TC161) TaxID=1328760 RepID=A0A165G121_XYLHT|nr:DUF1941-domain-containing protein [Xylona heveae TC161]KZF21615.1 DUF1941-domain-containing protein [Xylona heveae TC161]
METGNEETNPGGEASQETTNVVEWSLNLLQSPDDTSQFVGLAMLKPILGRREHFQDDPTLISRCWDSISPKFLDRLLRSDKSMGKSRDEASNMVSLGVSIIHSFMLLLPPEAKEKKKMLGRTRRLVAALTRSSPETTTQILQVLLAFSSTTAGASTLFHVDDLSPLLEITPQDRLALDVIQYALVNGITSDDASETEKQRFEAIISSLVLSFRDAPADLLLETLADLFMRLPEDILSPSPKWIPSLVNLIQQALFKRPTASARKSITFLCGTLINDRQFASTLFRDQQSLPGFPTQSEKQRGKQKESAASLPSETKPFSSLFINLLLIDIRATIPSLMENLASPTYPETATRLGFAYQIVFTFISQLISAFDHLDDEADADIDTDPDPASRSSLPTMPLLLAPDLLLKLRRDIAETISLTIEYLRDRWDAAVGGAAGLHPDARPRPPAAAASSQFTSGASAPSGTTDNNTTSSEPSAPLSLPWDTASAPITHDSLLLSALGPLGLWLREDDDNTALRNEAVGITDVLVGMYPSAPTTARLSILYALQGIVDAGAGSSSSAGVTDTGAGARTRNHDDDDDDDDEDDRKAPRSSGIDTFMTENGWKILASDLLDLLGGGSGSGSQTVGGGTGDKPNEITGDQNTIDHLLATEIIRVLLQITESRPGTGAMPLSETWMPLLHRGAGLADLQAVGGGEEGEGTRSEAVPIEVRIALWQLLVELLLRSPANVRQKCMGAVRKIQSCAKELLDVSSTSRLGGNRKGNDGGVLQRIGLVTDDDRDGLAEVLEGLEGLGIGSESELNA